MAKVNYFKPDKKDKTVLAVIIIIVAVSLYFVAKKIRELATQKKEIAEVLQD